MFITTFITSIVFIINMNSPAFYSKIDGEEQSMNECSVSRFNDLPRKTVVDYC